jgi:hypothetical protein
MTTCAKTSIALVGLRNETWRERLPQPGNDQYAIFFYDLCESDR